jgi:predicted DNA-binding mobile mystery protein A
MPQSFNPIHGLLQEQVEQRLAPWQSVPKRPPAIGWLRTIREALGMSAPQLGQRLGISRQGVADLERREREGAVTLESLAKAAAALDCDLVYAVVPRSRLESLIEAQARARALDEVRRVTHTMRLENQEASSGETARLIHQRTVDLLSRNPRKLWEVKPAAQAESGGKGPSTGKDRGSAPR